MTNAADSVSFIRATNISGKANGLVTTAARDVYCHGQVTQQTAAELQPTHRQTVKVNNI